MAGTWRDPCVDVTTVPPLAGFSDVPGQRETPVQGLGFPDGPVPNDGERLYSHPNKNKSMSFQVFSKFYPIFV